MSNIEVTKENIENKFTNAVDYFGLYIPNMLSFYSLFTKRVNNDIETIRICVRKDVTPYLEYNEEWVCSIDKSVFVFILSIEMYRFILHHCTHREIKGANAYEASTAVCNSKELQFFLNSAPQELAQYVIKATWSKKLVEETINQKLQDDDFYYENVYMLLNQKQESEQQSQSQNGKGQNQQQQSSQKGEGDQNDQDEENQSGSQGSGEEGQDSQEDQEDQEGNGGDESERADGSGSQDNSEDGEGAGDSDSEDQGNSGSGDDDGDQSGSEGSGTGNGSGSAGSRSKGRGKDKQKEDFDKWNESGEQNTEEWGQNNIVDEMIRDVVENKCKVSGWGRLSGDQVEEIMLKNKRKVNIVPIIAGFGASVRCRKRVSTRLRVNKRYDYLPGYRTDRKTKMLFAIDSSGSMSQSDIEKGCAILHNFYKKTEIDLAFWDAQMVEPKKLTRNIQKIEAPGRGGTDPACIGEWLKAHNKHYDGVVIFTDCYWEWNENNLGQHIFVISSEKEYKVPDFVKHHASIQELTHVFDD